MAGFRRFNGYSLSNSRQIVRREEFSMKQRQINRPLHKMYAFEGGWTLTGEVTRGMIGWANKSSEQLSQNMQKIKDGVEYENWFVQLCGYIVILFLVLTIVGLYLLVLMTMVVFVTVHVLCV